jgi:chromosome segregation ATPase
MDLLELAITLVEKGGAAAGLGGGYIATRVLNRVSEGLKDAKAARDNAHTALLRSGEANQKIEAIRTEFKSELQALRIEVDRIQRGSFTTEGAHDLRLSERIAQLETRMSSIEDDLDEMTKENKRSWEAIQRSVGRIEGVIQQRNREG